jgi:hypothetical protein
LADEDVGASPNRSTPPSAASKGDIEDADRSLFPVEVVVLQSIPGVGPVLSLTILLEIDTIDRFDTCKQLC